MNSYEVNIEDMMFNEFKQCIHCSNEHTHIVESLRVSNNLWKVSITVLTNYPDLKLSNINTVMLSLPI